MRQFHHLGLPTDEKQPGETYVPATKVWVTDPMVHKYRVEFLRFEADSPVQGPVRNVPHVAFRVDNLQEAISGANVLLGPFEALPGLTVVFVEQDGAVFEFMEYKNQPDAASWGR
ncbi:MAG: VOC family protein [Verrucomicrobiia bacterium]